MNDPNQVQTERPQSSKKWLVLLAVAALALMVLETVRSRDRGGHGASDSAIGRRLPGLQLQPLTGDAQPVTLEELSGRVVLINYWGTWCSPCLREFPRIVALARDLRDRQEFLLLSVSCGRDGDPEIEPLRESTETFLLRREMKLSTYADLNAVSRRKLVMAANLENFAFPTTVVLDQHGVIRGLWEGYASGYEDEMRELVEQLLEQR